MGGNDNYALKSSILKPKKGHCSYGQCLQLKRMASLTSSPLLHLTTPVHFGFDWQQLYLLGYVKFQLKIEVYHGIP